MKVHRPDRVHPARVKWIALGLAALSLVAGVGFTREVLRSRQIDSEIAGLKAEAERLRAKNFEITSLHASLTSGEYVEREARLKLNLQKEGERVVVVHKENETAVAASGTPDPEWTNARKWWNYFTDRNGLEAYARARQSKT